MNSQKDNPQKPAAGMEAQGSAIGYNHIDQVIAVMSGKGGVGKSLVTAWLGTSLARAGKKVGVLDADITGPSIPMLFGLHGPLSGGDCGLLPAETPSGIKVMSMNFLLPEEDKPIIWRGPLIGRAITQLYGDVMWGELDFLLVDLPPGTSDAALTIMQSLPTNGIIMVTTPQGLASMIVRKAVHMAQSVGVPILGVVENMSYFACPDTGKQHFIFGPSHAGEVSALAGAPLLAQIPISPEIAELCDAGMVEQLGLPDMPEMIQAFERKN